MKAAIYVRAYPRNDELSERRLTENGIQECKRFAHDEGYEVQNHHVYIDVSNTALTQNELTGLEQVKTVIHRHEVQVVIVPTLTHIGRRQVDIDMFLEEAKQANISVVSISSPPMGYRWNSGHTALEIDPARSEFVKQLFEQFKDTNPQ